MTNVELNLNSLNKELGTDYESLLELCQKHTIPESLIDKYWGILDMLVIVKYPNSVFVSSSKKME